MTALTASPPFTGVDLTLRRTGARSKFSAAVRCAMAPEPVQRYDTRPAWVLMVLGVACMMIPSSSLGSALFSTVFLLATSLVILAGPLGASKRFTLGTAAFLVAGIGILLADFTRKINQNGAVSSVEIPVADEHAAALAREIVSAAVLDKALKRGLSTLPRFAEAADPRAALRRSLSVELSPESHSIRLSMRSTLYHDELIIFRAIMRSCAHFPGVKPGAATRNYRVSTPWAHALFLPAAWGCWISGFVWWLNRRGKRVGKTPSG